MRDVLYKSFLPRQLNLKKKKDARREERREGHHEEDGGKLTLDPK